MRYFDYSTSNNFKYYLTHIINTRKFYAKELKFKNINTK